MSIITKLIIAVQILLIASVVRAVPNQLLEQLLLDHSALVAAESDFRMQRERGSLNGIEAADYATYIAKLMKRVAEGCMELARKGISMPPDVMCPSSSFALVKAAPINPSAEQTRAQKIAVLDAELNAELGEFDELLLREQARVKAGIPQTSKEDAGEGHFDSNDEGDASAGGDEKGSADSGIGTDADEKQSRTGDSDRETTRGVGGWGGKQKRTASLGQPPGVPDGSDDDVVARQLREAAEKETDPELRSKLWEEYKNYKKGTL